MRGNSMLRITHRTPVLCSVVLLLFVSGCDKLNEIEASGKEAQENKVELKKATEKLRTAQATLQASNDELVLLRAELEDARGQLQDKDKQLAGRDADLQQVRAELQRLNKQDAEARAFGEILLLYRQGQLNAALSRAKQFIQQFPSSKLVEDARTATTEIAGDLERQDQQARQGLGVAAPKQQAQQAERNVATRLTSGAAVTGEEIAPLLKKKTTDQVIAVLGRPRQAFPGGTEWGYANRGINTRNGEKDTLIVTFTEGVVSAVRVGYAGRKIYP